MTGVTPRLFTIPASAPFLDVLVRTLLRGDLVPGFSAGGAGSDPLALAGATLYLPTRRACRLARDTFLAQLGDAAILPRIVPMGDVDEDEIVFAQAGSGDLAALALDLPEALSDFERRLLLLRPIAEWAKRIAGSGDTPLIANTPAAMLELANGLARLIDDMTTRRVAWDELDKLVPHDFDAYWQKTLEFLQIARSYWPQHLAELGRIEAAVRRERLIQGEIARLATSQSPVIAAGSTGSMPVTADLLAAIARLPQGAVVLPGLDTHLDEPSWRMIGGDDKREPHDGGMPASAHPQFAMYRLLQHIGVQRDAVQILGAPEAHGREAFVSEAMRPAASTEQWQGWLTAHSTAAPLTGVTVIEATTAEEEALAIAVALRETAEHPKRTAALVTPDRALARRVAAALERWSVPVDDSGGDSLADTPAGVFARLATEAALGGTEPVTLLALLKHPLLRLGRADGGWREATVALECALLRGPRPQRGTAGLAHALNDLRTSLATPGVIHGSDPRRRLSAAQLDQAAALIAALATALAPLETLTQTRAPQSFALLLAQHRACLDALAADDSGALPLFTALGGRDLTRASDEMLATEHAASFVMPLADYAELFRTSIADRVVRKPELPGVRIRIFGPLEARLQQVDRIVLGGLIESVWPPDPPSDPWLSRPMRHKLGLDLPERRIGLSAHDFTQALGARDVFLARPAKLAGAPTVMSRFLQRIAALAGEDAWHDALERGEKYLRLTRHLDHPVIVTPEKRPEPRPPRDVRPKQLSVTTIEHWLRDPYTIYARYILKLPVLDAIDTPPGARDRGTVIHQAVGDFTSKFAAALPERAVQELTALGATGFARLDAFPEARAFWWPRFLRIADWFAAWDANRRNNLKALHAETDGDIKIPVGDRIFTLTARADRIEQLADGRFAILDYKTGAKRTEKQVRTGLAPQLTLEAAILRQKGFKAIPGGGSVAGLVYVSLKGGAPAGEEQTIVFKEGGTTDDHADRALSRLTGVIAQFENEDTPYRSLVHPMWKTSYGDYDHLARVKEWSLGDGGDDE
ncbi:MAG: double-strand break repair protein AddB [Pseudolabrys sp.]|nr:double-strand break repair protein AddB [Pseudolabrys sp.]